MRVLPCVCIDCSQLLCCIALSSRRLTERCSRSCWPHMEYALEGNENRHQQKKSLSIIFFRQTPQFFLACSLFSIWHWCTPVYMTGRRKHGMKKLLNEKQAAELLGISASWLRNARCNGNGPGYVTIGRTVRYSWSELMQWLNSCRKGAQHGR